MSRSPSLSFGPEWMRSSNNATSKKPDENKSPGGWASVAAGGGSNAHSLSTPTPAAATSSLSSSSIPSFAAIAGNGSHESKLFPKDEPKHLPVLTNEGGKKYTPDEMIEIWKEMDHSTQTRSMGRARSELYYSALANDPVTFAVKKKTAALDKEEDEDDPIALSNSAVAESLQSLGGEPVGFGGISRTSTVASSNGWNAFAPISQHSSTTDLTGMIAAAAASTPPPPPPGISLLSPESINWMYKDPTDKEYGPFTGKMMHEWYIGGWLQESLMIRRKEEQDYISLKTFRERVSNHLEPFLVPLPPVGPPGLDFAGKPVDPLLRLRSTPLATQFSGLQLNSWLAQSPSSPWTPQQPLTHTPLYQPTPQPLPQQQQGYFSNNIGSQPIADAVWGGVAAANTANANGIPQTYAPRPEVAPLEVHPEIVDEAPPTEVADKSTKNSPAIVQEEIKPEQPSVLVPPSPVVPATFEPVAVDSPAQVQEVAVPVVEEHVPVVPEEQQLSTAETLVNDGFESPSPEEKKAILAPWAKNVVAAPVKKASAPSLKEIQEREAAERKAKLSQKQQQQQASILQQAAALSSAAARSAAPALPSGANWANSMSPSSAAPQKTLAQIQQEEAAAAAKLKPAAPTIASAVKSSNPPGISAPSSASSSSDSAWTTVGPGGRKTGPNPLVSSIAKPATATAPIKRAVSSATAETSKSSSDDFLTWCKGAITDLNPGVNQTEMLSMLVELPASTDSKEIIADIIYANSSTMDGRRFAEEFLKRKKQADSEPQAASSWSEALQRQAQTKNENDGWNASFKVVTKKKNRRA